ncbi:rRNA biogenesis protein rrp36 [Polyrhizophydium stewartii]|uniref:rRNA biogenesis protein RRP36 n=1 Tax=Polyrhizophydium stewartii TaxID=2732419 RepID=A0ABR4MX25_9FUNG|nr:rRNA biogenesis protein rrp36 [Polyrhizophydium stewartii]
MVERDELAKLSFGDLLTVQKAVGLKKFKRIWDNSGAGGRVVQEDSGARLRKRKMQEAEESDDDDESRDGEDASEDEDSDDSGDAEDDDDDDNDNDDDEHEDEEDDERQIRRSKTAPGKDKPERPGFQKKKRENKNMQVARDPRFESYTGKLNEDLFKRSYGFINSYEDDEIEMLKKEIKKEKDAERRAELQATLTSKASISRKNARANKEKAQNIKREWRKSEKELVGKGKKPFFLKKSDFKRIELVDKYKSLVAGGQDLDKVLEKRRKKNASREHRGIPAKRRVRDEQ